MYLCIFCGQCADSCPVALRALDQCIRAGADKRQTIQYNVSPEAIELARKQAAEKAAAAAAKAEPPSDQPAS